MVAGAANLACQPARAALVDFQLRLYQLPDVDVISFSAHDGAKIMCQNHFKSIHFIHLHSQKNTIFAVTMLPISIINLIKEKSGMEFKNAKDFEVLSELFPANDRLGVNTLKRLMGYAKAPIAPRKATFDALAHYLGHTSWESLMGLQPSDSDWAEKAVCADEIKEGAVVEVCWLPNREIHLLCTGENHFRVTESRNGRLFVGDEVTIQHFRIDYPLEMNHIVRNREVMCDDKGLELCYIAGKQSGIKSLTIHD